MAKDVEQECNLGGLQRQGAAGHVCSEQAGAGEMLEGWVCMPLALHETCQIGSLCQLLGPHAIVGAEFPWRPRQGASPSCCQARTSRHRGN